ncbi:ABC transporter permease [Paenibacillus crassostreae]|uniref:ABC transporter permease n=1 Tax=Paenibacillus crassostreae TaxID=1763538 RepID=A0A167FW08_9BACL|nr:ABC transporter permease [Paenibacillus crassostreae]AOZ94006.1 ABC transporter permease [Paenibacillus crassostreae]OAB76959.1 ABC transporter permease [Paenibacillus crassostreae]
MNAVYSLCLANIRKKKLHNGLIALLILLSTLLLATSVTVILNTTNLFTDMHNKTHGPHEMLSLGDELHDPQKVHQWWNEQAEVTITELIPFRTLAGIKNQEQKHSAKLSSLTLYMMDTPTRPYAVDELIFAQGNEGLVPEKGTIWIPSAIAYLYEISVGDTLGFTTGEEKFELKVSAIIVDIPYGGPFPSGARIWMNHQDYTEQLQAMQGKDQYMIGLRFDDYSQSSSYWEQFEQDMGTPYLESKMNFGEMTAFYLIMNKIIGFIMVFLGVVMMLVALFTIGFTISDDILSNYKTIGVIKALGLSSRRMIGIYISQYALLAMISIIPGLIVSHWISKVIVESTLSSLKTGTSQTSLEGDLIAVVVGIFVFILVIMCVLFYSNKARIVKPMQAIRYGMSESDNSTMTKRFMGKENHGISFERTPLLLVIGIRNILKNRKASLLMILLAIIMSAVLVLGFVLLYSISSIKQTSPLWGYDSSDIALNVVNKSVFSRAEVDQELLSDPRIKNIGWMGYINGILSSEKSLNSDRSSAQPINLNLFVMEGSYDETGYTTLRGMNPRNKNEIAIGIKVAEHLDKEVGDVVEAYIEGYKHKLVITGIYQSIANQSISARVTVDVVRVNHLDYNNFELAFINLQDHRDSDRLINEMNVKYKDSASAVSMDTLLDATFKQAVASLILPMTIMGLLFTGVTMIIIYSISRINIRKESKTYGIYKSIGLTSTKIRWSVTLGIVFLSTIGSAVGIFIGVYFLPMILGSILSDYGIAKLPLILHWGGIIGLACVTVISAGIGSWASSRVVARTSPQILVVD